MTTDNPHALKYRAHASEYRVIGRDNTDKATGDSGVADDGDVVDDGKDRIGLQGRPSRIDGGQSDNNSEAVLTDGGRREVGPHIDPEYVGAHSGAEADTCQLWTGEEPTPCDNAATHTIVHYSGKYHHTAACDECGEPGDVEDWDRQWSTDREEIATDGGTDLAALCDRVEFADPVTDGGMEHSPAMQAAARLRTIADSIERLDRQTSPDEQCVDFSDGSLSVTLAFDLDVDDGDHHQFIDTNDLNNVLSTSGYSGGGE